MNRRTNPNWTVEEFELLATDTGTRELVSHPLMIANGRTYNAISTRRTLMARKYVIPQSFDPEDLTNKGTEGGCSWSCRKADVCDLSCEPKKKAA